MAMLLNQHWWHIMAFVQVHKLPRKTQCCLSLHPHHHLQRHQHRHLHVSKSKSKWQMKVRLAFVQQVDQLSRRGGTLLLRCSYFSFFFVTAIFIINIINIIYISNFKNSTSCFPFSFLSPSQPSTLSSLGSSICQIGPAGHLFFCLKPLSDVMNIVLWSSLIIIGPEILLVSQKYTLNDVNRKFKRCQLQLVYFEFLESCRGRIVIENSPKDSISAEQHCCGRQIKRRYCVKM